MKLTPQRIAIIEYLKGNKNHPSALEIYRAVTRQYPTMSLATVYNTLKALRDRQNIQEINIDPDKKRFDPNTMRHHHLICTRCRRILDIHTEFNVRLSGKHRHGFDIRGNHIDFYGICPQCAELQTSNNK